MSEHAQRLEEKTKQGKQSYPDKIKNKIRNYLKYILSF